MDKARKPDHIEEALWPWRKRLSKGNVIQTERVSSVVTLTHGAQVKSSPECWEYTHRSLHPDLHISNVQWCTHRSLQGLLGPSSQGPALALRSGKCGLTAMLPSKFSFLVCRTQWHFPMWVSGRVVRFLLISRSVRFSIACASAAEDAQDSCAEVSQVLSYFESGKLFSSAKVTSSCSSISLFFSSFKLQLKMRPAVHEESFVLGDLGLVWGTRPGRDFFFWTTNSQQGWLCTTWGTWEGMEIFLIVETEDRLYQHLVCRRATSRDPTMHRADFDSKQVWQVRPPG